MKQIFFIVALALVFFQCTKPQELDCTIQTRCLRISPGYSTCVSGEFQHIWYDSIWNTMSVCDTTSYKLDVQAAQMRLLQATSDEDFKKFVSLYPTTINCNCKENEDH